MGEAHQQLPNFQSKKDQKNSALQPESYSFFCLFRFADRWDVAMMLIGTLGSWGSGAAIPLFIYFLVSFNQAYVQQNSDELLSQAKVLFLQIIYMGVGAFLSAWAMKTFWLITGERQVTKCRKQYLESLLRQEIGYFDCVDQSQLSSKFSVDTLIFQDVIGQKMGLALQIIGCFIATVGIAFSRGWLLSLVMSSTLVLIIIYEYFSIVASQQKQKKFVSIYTDAGGKAQEVLSSIKTAKQLNGQSYEKRNYENSLAKTNIDLMRYCFKIAIFYGLTQAAIFLVYFIGLWQGSNCIQANSSCPISVIKTNYSMQDVLTIFFCFQTSSFTFSQLVPALKKIGQGKVAAQRIFKIIDRVPKVANKQNAIKPQHFEGYFQLKNVTFAYPKNKSAIVLNNISMKFHILRTALVGDSGCGKSTILQLLMRFYDPDEGSVLLDGVDIREIDLYWLRSKIGYVGQQPILFSGSIKDNLLMANSNSTQQDIDDALRRAEAYEFVYNQLDHKLDTFVGAGGSQISGGQKQRIAIARALLKKPKILLLDQATSALDRRNEKLIQNTFDKISQKLTTITVAHRIRTIINSNLILVIKNGCLEQSGVFGELQRFKDYQQKSEDNEYQEQKYIQNEAVQTESQKCKNLLENAGVVQSQRCMRLQFKAVKSQQKVHSQKQIQDRPWNQIFGRIFQYNKAHTCHFISAIIVSILAGLLYPSFSIFIPKMIVALRNLQDGNPQGRQQANQSAIAFGVIAAAGLVLCFGQSFLGNLVANQITNKLRLQTFDKYLKMPVAWFDKSQNSSGILSSKLTTDCQTINGVTSTFVFILLQSLSSVITGFVIAFAYQWRITLVAIGLIPLVALGGAVRNHFRVGLSQKIEVVHKQSEDMIMESLINIRTVISLNAQQKINSQYCQQLENSYKIVVHTGIIAGLMNGLAIILMYSVLGALLYVGAIFTSKFNISLGDLLTGIFQCFFVGLVLGSNMQYLPDMSAAKRSAIRIFDILDQQDEQQMQIRENSKMLKQGINGNIKFDNVSFQYQGRLTKVFENLSFQIKNGQKVAFVGPSGCGKSTIIQLILRFYFPQKGKITIGNIDIRDFDIRALRSKFGVVSQQPVLFSRSFEQNIRYNTQATEEEMRMAAKRANALSFIEGDQAIEGQNEQQMVKDRSQGFNRVVGIKGLHISGGQKQRVAIARALLRNPQILLLDEATSALDAENQLKIQQSLESIMKGRTTITVAHRFQTIKHSDNINVLQAGKIVQQGRYQDLISKRQYFYNLLKGGQAK